MSIDIYEEKTPFLQDWSSTTNCFLYGRAPRQKLFKLCISCRGSKREATGDGAAHNVERHHCYYLCIVLVYYSIGRTISTKPNLTSYLHTFYYDITYCPNDDTNTT